MAVQAKPKKRIRRDPETTRGLILDTTEKLMIEEGYAAVSSRRIARELELNAATVHYYYPATDDIFIDLHRRMTDRQMQRLQGIADAKDPLREYWKVQSGSAQTALGVEFLALLNHRKAIREKLAGSTGQAREIQARLLEGILGQLPAGAEAPSPLALTTILAAVGRLLANEERVGISTGHDEVRALVERALDTIVERGRPGRDDG